VSPALREQLALLPDYLSRHLLLCMTALVVGIALSLPLAFAAVRWRSLRGPVLMIASAVQTIPGLALLALMVPLLRQIGFLPAVIALILYSVLPVLRNTVTGIVEVDPNLVEAGTGLGMTPTQLLLRVQVPIAMPMIVAGIRTAAVWVVGLATLSTPVGATSLGNYIFSGLQTQNYTAVLVGCVAAAALALVLDRLIHALETAVAGRNRTRIATTIGVTILLIAAGLAPIWMRSPSAGAAPVVVGTKTFTEQYILGAIIADELETAGFTTRTVDSLGSTVAFDALRAGRIDCYVDYTGTIWANYMHRTDNPGREAILRGVTEWLAAEHGIELAARLGFENAYALAMTSGKARDLGVRTIADLAQYAPQLKLGGDYEFFARPEWADVRDAYGLGFRDLVTMDSTLMYAAVAAGEVDVIAAFSTDGRIPAFDLALLDDTRNALPPYDAVLLIGPQTAARSPELRGVLAALGGAIDGTAMRAANRHVDLEGGTVGEAARMLQAALAGPVTPSSVPH
jgi:osmoprotectant transport system substrate-binding protein/osmoprotectant transport system permease protein